MALDAQRNWDESMADDLDRILRHSIATTTALPHTNGQSAKPTATCESLEAAQGIPIWSRFPPDAAAYHLPTELLQLILEHIRLTTPSKSLLQRILHAWCLVSRGFYSVALPFLYSSPLLSGPSYNLFLRTICPSINLGIRRSPLAPLVRTLDLSLLVHQGTKSTTARLLGRTKDNLLVFIAPQASFSLTSFPALTKCRHLQVLDLSLVSEAPDMSTLFETISHITSLRELRLPRSGGHNNETTDPARLRWPPGLQTLFLAGGLSSSFWRADLDLPSSLSEIGISHVPHLEDHDVHVFLRLLRRRCSKRWACESGRQRMDLWRMTVKNCPHLSDTALDDILSFLPGLLELSVSLDYVTPDMLDVFRSGHEGNIPSHRGARLYDLEEYAYEGHGHENGKSAGGTEDTTSIAWHRLQILELTDSGDTTDDQQFTPIDLLLAIDDMRALPRLRLLRVQESLNWHGSTHGEELESLEDRILSQGKEMVELGLLAKDEPTGVEITHRRRR